MKIEYRTAYKEGVGYFAQSRQWRPVIGRMGKSWRVICKKVNGFYLDDSSDYPYKTEEEAIKCCENYDKWFERLNNSKTVYKKVDIK